MDNVAGKQAFSKETCQWELQKILLIWLLAPLCWTGPAAVDAPTLIECQRRS